jgi:hypothetical protein
MCVLRRIVSKTKTVYQWLENSPPRCILVDTGVCGSARQDVGLDGERESWMFSAARSSEEVFTPHETSRYEHPRPQCGCSPEVGSQVLWRCFYTDNPE